MGFALASLRCVTTVLALWSIASVIVAFFVAGLFRLQARVERMWRELVRREAWREATDTQ